ncbi:MAG: hypothetical protein PHG82_01445 [Candidatus Gracilibacteria bacterium]|nr:hypothetical protein [Candidatus Gracilibacteria bacterium]
MLEIDLLIDKKIFDTTLINSNKSIVFFLFHKLDLRQLFLTFTIIDLAKKELIYINSFLPNNEKIVNEFDPNNKIKFIKQPHNIIELEKGKSFLCFTEGSYLEGCFFYYVDYCNKKLKIYFGEDFEFAEIGKIIDICPTNYKDPEDSSFFYFSAITEDKSGYKFNVLFKAKLDLAEINIIHYDKVDSGVTKVYHTTKKYNNLVLFSNFYDSKIYSQVLDEKIPLNELYLKVINELYIEYKKSNFTFSKDEFSLFLFSLNKNAYNYFSELVKFEDKLKFYFFIQKFLKSKGVGTIEEYIDEFSYKILPSNGFITTLNINTFEKNNYPTTYFDSAHFEIDEIDDDIFVSSHNFLRLENVYYLGNAAIDKFKIINSKLEQDGTFTHSTGYRFTSHKVFTSNGKRYLCITGHPNRLFFVDAKTMNLEYFVDIGDNHFSGIENIKKHLNNNNFPTNLAIEVIDNNGTILLIPGEGDYIILYSFEEKRIIDKIKYRNNELLSNNLFLKDYLLKTTHIQYLN